jgi:hypothetical protein
MQRWQSISITHRFINKAPFAIRQRTSKRSMALMSFFMLRENRLLSEIFSANAAPIRFWVSVDSYVLVQYGLLSETSPLALNVGTSVWLLVLVDSNMLSEMTLLPKSLA